MHQSIKKNGNISFFQTVFPHLISLFNPAVIRVHADVSSLPVST